MNIDVDSEFPNSDKLRVLHGEGVGALHMLWEDFHPGMSCSCPGDLSAPFQVMSLSRPTGVSMSWSCPRDVSVVFFWFRSCDVQVS